MICEESGRIRRKDTYVHSCHSIATGENKAGLATGLALALALLLMLTPLSFPSHLLLLIHHRELPMHSTLLCDGRRASDGEDGATVSRPAFPAARWWYRAAMAVLCLSVCLGLDEWLAPQPLSRGDHKNIQWAQHLASWGSSGRAFRFQ